MRKIPVIFAKIGFLSIIVLTLVSCNNNTTPIPSTPTTISPLKTTTASSFDLPTIATGLPKQSGNIIYIQRGTQGHVGTIGIGLVMTQAADYVDSNGANQHGMTARIQLSSRDALTQNISVYLGQTFEYGGYSFYVNEIDPTNLKPGDTAGASGGGMIGLLFSPK
jgi:hypothetical protein